MPAFISAILALLAQVSSLTTEAGVVGTIIADLTNWLPIIFKEAKSLVQPVKNIIAALSANPATTAEQITTLKALDAQCDAAFEAAATAAEAEDAAADAARSAPTS